MTSSSDPSSARDLDDFVRAFEEAQARDGQADPADFLPAPGHPLRLDVLRELVRVDLEYSWARGQPNPLEHYLSRFPELLADRRTLAEAAFEEYRLRHQAGQHPSADEYRQRYDIDTGGWPAFDAGTPAEGPEADDLGSWGDSSLDEHGIGRLLRDLPRSDPEAACLLAQAMPALPEGGSRFLGFELIAELGRGTFGRVYLARQGDLANRLVALKIAVDLVGESQSLAQLQHTNIVPIYSVHQAGPFQAVCMPYFRSTTLGAVLDDLVRDPVLPTSGRELVRLLCEQAARGPGVPESSPGPGDGTLRALEQLAYVEAVLWLAARLADGLAHAHERGIIHRDLKPANVLWTAEGQPMLVDFNLSADTKLRAAAEAARVGGTLPYMAPEHLTALGGGSAAVDARSDLYSLGVILHELLTGRRPFPVRRGHLPEVLPLLIADRQQGPVTPRSLNRAISPAVESILRRLLHPDPARRYQRARDLEEDLQRQLTALPLRHAPDPSPRERLRKWARRHPRVASPAAAGAFVVALVIGLAALFFWQQYHREHGHRQVALQGKRVAEDSLEQTRAELVAVKKRAAETLRDFQRALAAVRELEGQAGAVQRLFDLGRLSKDDPGALEACVAALSRYRVLSDPEWWLAPEVRHLPPAVREALFQDIGELLYLLGRSLLLQAADARRGVLADEAAFFALPIPPDVLAPLAAARVVARHRVSRAHRLHQLATTCYKPGAAPIAFLLQGADLADLHGRPDKAGRLRAAAAVAPRTSREAYLAAYEHAARHDFRRALTLGKQALLADRQKPATWFLLGVCHAKLGEPAGAVRHYDVCLALKPDWSAAAYNRGLAHFDQEHWAEAVADFDLVLAQQPDFTAGRFYRARALAQLGRYQDALRDLDRAVRLKPSSALYRLRRAKVRRALGDKTGAEEDLAWVRATRPHDAAGWTWRAEARAGIDPEGALADFRRATELDPKSLEALLGQATLLEDSLGRRDEALPLLDRALAAHPTDIEARMQRALVLARLRQPQRARADAEACLARDPSPARKYEAGCVYALTSRQEPKDRRRAIRLLTEAVAKGCGRAKLATDLRLLALRGDRDFQRLRDAAQALDLDTPPTREK